MTTLPNILLVVSDQHHADVLGCAGHRQALTPNYGKDHTVLREIRVRELLPMPSHPFRLSAGVAGGHCPPAWVLNLRLQRPVAGKA